MNFRLSGRLSRCVWLPIVVLLLSACSEQELYSRLSEQQANEMVALLYSADMPATKQTSGDGQFTVLTSPKSFARAVDLLRANGLPKESYDTLGNVFAKEGFVSSPLEERARLNHAMSQEIAHTIASIDGVVMARVHLAVPERNDLVDKVQPASASVFVKHRPDVDLTSSVSSIKALVVNGIENLPYDQVTVALFKADLPQRDHRLQPANGPTQSSPQAGGQTTLLGSFGGGSAGSAAIAAIIAGLLLSIGALVWRGRQR